MTKEAEAHAEEDKKFQELVEARNRADQLISATEKTLKENPDKVSEGDKKNIEAAIEELKKVKPDNPVYNEAVRLLEFLQMFKDIDKDSVPSNSLIREFIGGSCFYQY